MFTFAPISMDTTFLEELRQQFDRHCASSDNLTKKATNVMTIAGIILAIFIGFSIPTLGQDGSSIYWHVGVLSSTVSLFITILLCMWLNSPESLKVPFLGEELGKKENQNLKDG